MVKVWRYYLPNERPLEGWAEIMLCSTGMFAAVSDYGDYAYAWRAHGERDFRIFVADLVNDPDYFMRKVGMGLLDYDDAATIRNVKRYIIARRRGVDWSAETARAEWGLLSEHNGLSTREDFALWHAATQIVDAHEFWDDAFPSSLVAFSERVLPRLRTAILAEMAAERQVA